MIQGTINNVPVSILQDSPKKGKTLDGRSTFSFTVYDSSGTSRYYPGQVATVTDTTTGATFTGFIASADEQNLPPQTANTIAIQLIDLHYLPDKRYWAGDEFDGQYAGDIAVALAAPLASEGIKVTYAADRDDSQADFQAGTLTNVIATANNAGDLELARAGTDTTINVQSATTFNAGAYFNSGYTNGALTPTATPAIKMVANCTLNNAGNLYTYMKIWGGSQLLGTGYYLIYDMWIDPASPEAKMSVDITFSDGSVLRDTFFYTDSQALSPHPNTDLSGLANGQWYHREFWMANLNGKTVQFITLACEGDKVGVYTGWFKNIRITDQNKTTVLNIFNGTLNTSQQMQNVGYSSTSLSVVNTYALPYYTSIGETTNPWTSTSTMAYWRSAANSIDAVKIVRSSFLSWQASTPAGTLCYIRYSLDYPGSNTVMYLCQNNASLPSLPAGLNVAGRSIYFEAHFYRDASANPLASPEVTPSLQSIQLTLNSSYNMTGKTDVQFACVQNSDWNQTGAVLTNTNAYPIADKLLSLQGFVNNFDTSIGFTSLFGGGTPGVTISNRTLAMTAGPSADARLKLNDAPQLANFTAEIDVLAVSDATYSVGLVYRTTNWGNSNDSYAYSVTLSQGQILLGKGNNSTGTGAFTSISQVAVTLTSGNWHRLKVVVNGTNHQVFLDDVRFINATDSTFTAAGSVGLRVYCSGASARTGFFDNFGIMPALTGTWVSPSISLAPATTYGSSLITWRDQREDTTNTTILVERSLDGGTTWATVTSGSPIPGLTAGQSLSSATLKIRVTLSTTTATLLPAIDNLIVRVLQSFSASGSRVSPSLNLKKVVRAGSTLVSWNGIQPPNTSIIVDSSLDNSTFTQLGTGASGGFPVAGISTPGDPFLDDFQTNSRNLYSLTGTGTWTWDLPNDKLTGTFTGGRSYLLYLALTVLDSEASAIMDTANGAGLIIRWNNSGGNNYYFARIQDSAYSVQPNTVNLYKALNGAASLLTSASISFTRGTPHVVTLSMIDNILSFTIDGVTVASYDDSTHSPLAAGKMGMLLDTGNGVYYAFRAKAYGTRTDLANSGAGMNVWTRARLSTTDPTASPALTALSTSVRDSAIQNGALIPTTRYSLLNGSKNTLAQDYDDLAKQSSNYFWDVKDDGSLIFQSRVGTLAPWAVTLSDVLIDSLKVSNDDNYYRNSEWITGAIDLIPDTKSVIGDGTSKSWSLGFNIDSIQSITVNGVSMTFGVQGVDSGKDFYYTPGSNTLTQDNADPVLNNTQTLVITYTGRVTTTINTRRESDISARAAIDHTSGIVELVEDGSGLTKTAAITMAEGRLDQYCKPSQRVITFKTRRAGLEPGQLASFFIPIHGINSDLFLITDVSVSWQFEQVNGVQTLQAYYSVSATEGAVVGDWTRWYANFTN